MRRLLAELPEENVAFVCKCLCLPRQPGEQGTVVDHVRLFRNLPGLQWEHRIHEQILPALRRRGATSRWCDVVVHHLGYQDRAVLAKKLERDLRILTKEYAEQPDHPFTLFNMGITYQELGKLAEAIDFFRRSLRASPVTDSIVRKLYASIARCERLLHRPGEALKTCREGRAHYPEDVEMLLQESEALDALGDPAGAIHCLERILQGSDRDHFASVATGLRGYVTRHNLAVHYLLAGRIEEAEAQWQQALAEQPCWPPALYGLADVCLARRDGAGLERVIGELRKVAGTEIEIEVLRARLHLVRSEFADARAMLEALTARHPGAFGPLMWLGITLLEEERDLDAAERALRAALAICPSHVNCTTHLDRLLRRHGRQA